MTFFSLFFFHFVIRISWVTVSSTGLWKTPPSQCGPPAASLLLFHARRGQAPCGVRHGQAPCGVRRGQAPCGVRHGQAPCCVRRGQAPCGVRHGQAPCGVRHGQAPCGVRRGQAPCGVRRGQAPCGVRRCYRTSVVCRATGGSRWTTRSRRSPCGLSHHAALVSHHAALVSQWQKWHDCNYWNQKISIM